MQAALVFVLFGCGVPCLAQTSRDYYNEIYKAGGLDRMADGYACFDDDPTLQTFFIFGQSVVIKQMFIDAGKFSSLPKAEQAKLNRGFLVVRGYDRGVPLSSEEFYEKDGESWVQDGMVSGKKTKERLIISMETLRYKRTVELDDGKGNFSPLVSRYGKCENVLLIFSRNNLCG